MPGFSMMMKPPIPKTESELAYLRHAIHAKERQRRIVCEGCGESGILEMHEIIERSHTRGNLELRLLSYQPEMVAFLCRTCHNKAGVETERYFEQNIRRFGLERVGNTLRRMLDLRPTLLYQLQLPEVLRDYIQTGT